MSRRNLAYKVIDRVFLVAYGTEAPTDEEWAAYLGEIERQGVDHTLTIIITGGSGPTAAQRRHLERVIAGHEVPVAVLSDSAAVRAMVAVMSWFNRRLRAFPPEQIYAALSHLEIPTSRAELIQQEIGDLCASLGGDKEPDGWVMRRGDRET